MSIRQKLLDSLLPLKAQLQHASERETVFTRAEQHNPWFTQSFISTALESIEEEFLDPEKCAAWLASYTFSDTGKKRVGLIMAGNIPLVGFHDLLCVLCSGHKAVMKLSDKDQYLVPFVMDAWIKLVPEIADHIEYADKLEKIDAVIATGSNNSARYFEYYFKAYPHIFRKNRNGVAVITGEESQEDLEKLSDDIFLFFGLGCRNVSKVFVPQGYSFDAWPDAMAKYSDLANHNKYRNNLDYNYAIYLINQIPHLHLGFLILKEDEAIASRIGSLHYQFYRDAEDLESQLEIHREEIQCVVSKNKLPGWDHVHPGQSQRPALSQYADGVDTLLFLTDL
jgi:hypothetical protein